MPDAVDLNEYTIFPATPAQQQEIIDLAHSVYQPDIPKQAWQTDFEAVLRGPHSQDGEHQAWVLARRDDPQRTAVSHVQSERRRGWRRDAKGVHEIYFYGITFVQTPAEHRRKGFSHRLLRLLHHLLAPHTSYPAEFGAPPPSLPAEIRAQLPPAAFSILTSVAPPGFYRSALVGPDADKRPGWEDRRYENARFRFPLPADGAGLAGAKEWTWAPIRQREVSALADVLTRVKRREIEQAPVGPDEVVLHPDPSQPGILDWANEHWTPSPFFFRSIGPDEVVGFHFHPVASSGASASAGAASVADIDEHTPLVLFLPHGGITGHHLVVNLTANLSPALMPAALTALGEAGRALPAPVEGADLWGHGEDAPFVRETQRLVGGEWVDRTTIDELPCGVAWYGDEKEWRVDGLEFWSSH